MSAFDLLQYIFFVKLTYWLISFSDSDGEEVVKDILEEVMSAATGPFDEGFSEPIGEEEPEAVAEPQRHPWGVPSAATGPSNHLLSAAAVVLGLRVLPERSGRSLNLLLPKGPRNVRLSLLHSLFFMVEIGFHLLTFYAVRTISAAKEGGSTSAARRVTWVQILGLLNRLLSLLVTLLFIILWLVLSFTT